MASIVGPLFWKKLRDNRQALFWWMFGTACFVVFALAFYPEIKDQPGLNNLYASKELQAITGTGDITSPAGYLIREVYSIVGPMLTIIFGIILGSRLLAGEEGQKTLPLLLANPVSRNRVVWDMFGALKVALLLLSLVIFLSVIIANPLFGITGVDIGKIAVATLMLFLIGYAFGALAFLIGAATGNRGLAGGIAGSLAIGMYLLNTLQQIVDSLEPYRWISLFYYLDTSHALVHYPPLSYGLVLVGSIGICWTLSFLVFRKRDIHV